MRELPIDPVLEKGYKVRMLRDDFSQIIEGWMARSDIFRATADRQIDCSYGAGPEDKLDVFHCGKSGAPLFVFIHGGYWQSGDKSVYSFLAEPFVESGVDVAIIGYQLCPATTMTAMVGKIRKAISWLYFNAEGIGVSSEHINVSGHSAGGHLTAMVLATRWSHVDKDLPDDLVKTGIPISGLYQLEPLLQTTISDVLGMDKSEALRLSPYLLQPSSGAPVLVTLGGEETPVFHWQADQLIHQWNTYGVAVEKFIAPGVDHFDIINRLSQSDSELFNTIGAWLQ